ncbi:hypothetical protein K2173_010871 [Erythroxylum novogranatense]|uniref:Calmodulin-binding domain-containing protein n=1 Tax=Erythroxylum novogranatense TaxID=1862640 RepID=A0AAV8SZW8_9ROSI|nr:hypothetical protein K2173_010871 [Erythroxylum novogranatense]
MTSKSSLSSSSRYDQEAIRIMVGTDSPKRKVKKLRSIRLTRLSSLKLATTQAKIEHDDDDDHLSASSLPMEVSDASPNYMKNTTSSDAKKEIFQKSTVTLSRQSDFKSSKSLMRLSSSRFRRPLVRRSSGGTDLKKKLKKSRSIKSGNRFSGYLKRTNYNEASACDYSESGLSCNDENTGNSMISDPKFDSSGSQYVRDKSRTSSLRPLKVLTKMGSLTNKRASVKKGSKVSDSNIQKVTCSSALKDPKLPKCLELEAGGTESEGISVMKVCPYSYCSLHGHHHSDQPSLKRFVSMRRRLLKNQKNMKSEGSRSGRVKKGSQTRRMASWGDSEVLEAASECRVRSPNGKMTEPEANVNEEGIQVGNSADVAETIVNEASYSSLSNEISESPKAEKSIKTETCLTSNYVTKTPILLKDIGRYKDEEISEGGEVYQGGSTDKVPSLEIGKCVRDSKVNTLTCSAEPRAINHIIFTSSSDEPVEEQIAACEEKKEDSVPDCESPTAVSESEGIAYETQAQKQKHMGLWGLIYRHMVSTVAVEDKSQLQVDQSETVKRHEDAIELPRTNGSECCSDSPGIEQDMSVEDEEGSSPRIHIYQHDAIKLVQEAFDRILSEIPDQSSDNQSTKEEAVEVEDPNVSTLSESGRASTLHDSEELRLKADKVGVSGEEKEESNVQNKPSQQAPKNWSTLKKILIFRRFVKALEQVRNFSPQKPRVLPVEPDPEAEKVQLRHQTILGRKNSEEWMLDYALQKVISTLAPAQKRKVALLVQAFETVSPLPEIHSQLQSLASESSQLTPSQTSSSDGQNSGKGKETKFGLLLRKGPSIERSFNENHNDQADVFWPEKAVSCSNLREISPPSGCVETAMGTAASEAIATDSKEDLAAFKFHNLENHVDAKDDQPDFQDNLVKVLETKSCDKPSPSPLFSPGPDEEFPEVLQVSASEFHGHEPGNQIHPTNDRQEGQKYEIQKDLNGSAEYGNIVSSLSISEPQEETSEVKEEKIKSKNELAQGFIPLEESGPICTNGIEHEKQEGKQNYLRLWYLIYKHMVSGSTSILEGENNEEKGLDTNRLMDENNSKRTEDVSETNQDVYKDNPEAGKRDFELQQIEAIRLVEEAIDEIPLPEIQDDSSDDRSVSSDIILDHNKEKKAGERGEGFSSTSTDSTKHRFDESNGSKLEHSPGTKEPQVICDSTTDQQNAKTAASEPENKLRLQKQSSWSHLKKVILLKRFIKALEKVKKFNPKEPRFLPLDPQMEAETVHLRHQDSGDRKSSDEWMLDHTLQQVVSKLSPVRKRKVALLVEAFESVIPTVRS